MHPAYGGMDKVVIESFRIHGIYSIFCNVLILLDIRFPTSLEQDGSDASTKALPLDIC
jgi:hypothetical protein